MRSIGLSARNAFATPVTLAVTDPAGDTTLGVGTPAGTSVTLGSSMDAGNVVVDYNGNGSATYSASIASSGLATPSTYPVVLFTVSGPALYAQLDETTADIAGGVALIAAELGIAMTTNRVGSMFTWFFTPQPVTDFATASQSDTSAFARFHHALMQRGVWLPPSQFEAAFVSAAHGEAEVAAILAAAGEALHEVVR